MVSWITILGAVVVASSLIGWYIGLAWYWNILITFLLVASLVGYVLYIGFQKVKPKPQKDIPCPPYTHPVLGHPDKMLSPVKHELRLEVCESTKALFHQLVVMNHASVFINDAEVAADCIKKFPAKGEIYKVFQLDPSVPDIISSDGKESEMRRRVLGPCLEFLKLDPAYISNLIDVLETHANNKEPLDMAVIFSYAAFDIMSYALFEYELGALKGSEEGKCLHTSFRNLVIQQSKVGIYADTSSPPIPADVLKESQLFWKSFTQKMQAKMVTDAEDYLQKKGELNWREKFSHALKQLSTEEAEYGAKQATSDIHQIFRHGYECIAGQLSWMFYALAKNAKVRTRLMTEISQTPSSGNPSEYLECVVKETLRRFPVAGNTTVRTVTEPGSTLAGETAVAVGIPIHLHIWSLQNTSREWDRPKEFTPERWLVEKEEAIADDSSLKRARFPQCPFFAGDTDLYNGVGHTIDSLSFMPFSTGSRMCLGKSLVLKVLRQTLQSVCGKYRLDFAESVWAEDYGLSANAVIVPSSSKSTTMRVFVGVHAAPEDKVDEGWADDSDEDDVGGSMSK